MVLRILESDFDFKHHAGCVQGYASPLVPDNLGHCATLRWKGPKLVTNSHTIPSMLKSFFS